MHVRRLSLQGFKTFASKASFEFETGITAIVGPNGSGKSNLADALRWALGEQSYSTLRSRRTEDVIFSGSSGRPPMGIAEVSLLFDNEDSSLPIDFTEVEITRRAHRSGSNEYLINRRRVRLRDVEEVLGGLTSSYVVIHQGLVDEALSLRPQERRVLLEEAAEVRRYHERRKRAQDRLERTEANMTRISDLRHELTPRLRVLERQSSQARQLAETESSLLQDLRSWYRRLWEEAHIAWTQSLQEEEKTGLRLTQARDALAEGTAEANRLRRMLQESQRQQEEKRQQEVTLRRRETALRQELAQVEGEQRALQRYAQELCAEIDRWRQELTQQQDRLSSVETVRLTLAQQIEHAQAELNQREEAFRQVETDLQSPRRDRQKLQQELAALAVRIQEIEQRQEYLSTRQEALSQEKRERTDLLDDIVTKKQQSAEKRTLVEARRKEQEAALTELRHRSEALRLKIVAAENTLHQINESMEQARWNLANVRGRLAVLTDRSTAHDSVAFLQMWAREQGRPEFVSLISSLGIPDGLEAAVAIALGAHAPILLPPNWTEACTALDALKAAQAGEVTLIAAEELRPPPLPATIDSASEGLLLDHLTFAPEQRPALVALLGRTLLATSLESARQITRRLEPGWVVVTRQGEAVTAEGILRGGKQPPGQGTLEQERERQALAQALAEAESTHQQHEQAREEAQRELTTYEAALADLKQEQEELRLALGECIHQSKGLEHELAQFIGEENRQRQRLDQLCQEKQRLEEERTNLQTICLELSTNQSSLQQRWEKTQQAEQAAQEYYTQTRDLLQEARTTWAVVRKERENQQALEDMARHNISRLGQQIAEAEQRLQQALAQQQTWIGRATSLNEDITQVSKAIAATLESPLPTPVTLDELAHWEEETSRLRQEVLEAEGTAARASVEAQRQQDRLKEILRRGLAEVGPEASAYGPASEAFLNALLEDPPEWARIPIDLNLSQEDLERRIAHLREQARRIGPVNPLAEEEFHQTQERYDFLGQQLQDLHDATRSLRQVITELDQAMEKRFQETFVAINHEFQSYFTRLFGGGTASLRMVRMEEKSDGLAGLGVEIIARPPGKRAHSLALLSGGERALASSALLFAILKVNPRPFCLLDEVDAMLDEANVGRFRECLEELAEQTQFIVITHNRGTIEAADTLYGVSMADDGTSRVISLRLEEVAS